MPSKNRGSERKPRDFHASHGKGSCSTPKRPLEKLRGFLSSEKNCFNACTGCRACTREMRGTSLLLIRQGVLSEGIKMLRRDSEPRNQSASQKLGCFSRNRSHSTGVVLQASVMRVYKQEVATQLQHQTAP